MENERIKSKYIKTLILAYANMYPGQYFYPLTCANCNSFSNKQVIIRHNKDVMGYCSIKCYESQKNEIEKYIYLNKLKIIDHNPKKLYWIHVMSPIQQLKIISNPNLQLKRINKILDNI